MDSSKIYIHIRRFDDIDTGKYEGRYKAVLEESRFKRYLKGNNPKIRQSLLKTGIFLYEVLAGYDISVDEIEREENGKPYIKGRDDFFFNLSHSGEYLIAAVSGQPVGVDIQKKVDARPGVIDKIFRQDDAWEHEKLIKENFKLVWAIKEAYCKLTGTGIATELKDISFRTKQVLLCESDRFEYCIEGDKSAFGTVIFDNEDYSAVVCVENAAEVIKL